MRHRVPYSSSPLAVAVAVAALLMWPPASEAQLPGGILPGTILPGTTLPGTILPGTTTVLADTGTLAAGTSDALQASQIAGAVSSLLTGEVLHAVTISYPDEIDSEASLAALFLEHGFRKIEPAIVDAFAGRIEYALTSHVDFKTELQEALARRGKSVNYTVLNVEGAPHDRTFTFAANIDGEQAGVGNGRSKKAAEQTAAQQVLAKLGIS